MALAIYFCILGELEIAYSIKSTQCKHISLRHERFCSRSQHAFGLHLRWTCQLLAWEFAMEWARFRGIVHLIVTVKKTWPKWLSIIHDSIFTLQSMSLI